MRVQLLAAGTRMPDWVTQGVEEYARRIGPEIRFELRQIALGRRGAGANSSRAISDEGARMLAAIYPDAFVVTLEVQGKALSTEELAAWLKSRLQDGHDLAILIGGPDGLAPDCLQRSSLRWSLSPLTLPHGLVRIVVVEQLYRALSLLKGHPYHRG